MKTEHWITIVLITTSFIAQLTAPMLSALVMSRINQPKPMPDPNQPKNLTQSKGGRLSHIVQSPWFAWGQLLNIPLSLWALSRELVEAGPVTRSSILAISITIGGIFLCVVNTEYILQNQYHRKNMDVTFDLLSKFLGIIEKQGSAAKARLDALEKPHLPPPAPPGLLRRILAAIRKPS